MTGMPKKILISVFIFILMIFSIAGCNMLRSAPPKEETGNKKHPPKALLKMEQDTDNMIRDLEQVRDKRAKQEREKEQPSDEQSQQTGQQEQQVEQQGQEQERQSGSQSRQQEQQPQKTPQPVPEPKWPELETMVETLHENWNTFEPRAKADGAMAETMKSFEDQLIVLTEQIMARNEEKTLTAANALYSHYPAFLKLYSHNQPPEVKEVRGLTRQILLYGQQDKWEEAKPLQDKMKLAWQEAKTKMKKPDKDLTSKIDAALYDFNYVVTEKKINLAKIKGNILIKNLEQVE